MTSCLLWRYIKYTCLSGSLAWYYYLMFIYAYPAGVASDYWHFFLHGGLFTSAISFDDTRQRVTNGWYTVRCREALNNGNNIVLKMKSSCITVGLARIELIPVTWELNMLDTLMCIAASGCWESIEGGTA